MIPNRSYRRSRSIAAVRGDPHAAAALALRRRRPFTTVCGSAGENGCLAGSKAAVCGGATAPGGCYRTPSNLCRRRGSLTELRSTAPASARVPASVVLQRLHDEAPNDHFTLGWLMGRLRRRSFGLIILLLAVVAIAPGFSVVAGLLLMIPAFEMIIGHTAPTFPARIAAHSLPTRHLAALVQRAVPVLRYLETMIHPRWLAAVDASKRLDGVVVMLLSATLFVPIPLSNVVPALVIALIALANLEEDGVLLVLALLAGAIALTLAAAAAWATLVGAEWVSRFW